MSEWNYEKFKAKIGNAGMEKCVGIVKWKLNTILILNETVLIAENEMVLKSWWMSSAIFPRAR